MKSKSSSLEASPTTTRRFENGAPPSFFGCLYWLSTTLARRFEDGAPPSFLIVYIGYLKRLQEDLKMELYLPFFDCLSVIYHA